MTREDKNKYRKQVLSMYDRAGIVLTDKEKDALEMVDFGLRNFEKTGLSLVVYVNTKLCCAKEMVLLPGQTCPEHIHQPLPEINYFGKEETFRCRYGEVYLYTSGDKTESIKAKLPSGEYSVFHETVLRPGEQFTIVPGTLHWFQGGENGAVVSEFSTSSHDEYDLFTDKKIVRIESEE